MKNSLMAAAITMLLIPAIPAKAEITSRPCPYSCRTQGIPKKVCKDWKESGLCYIDDLRRNPGVPAKFGYTPPNRHVAPPPPPPQPQHRYAPPPPPPPRYDDRRYDDRRRYDRDYDRAYERGYERGYDRGYDRRDRDFRLW